MGYTVGNVCMALMHSSGYQGNKATGSKWQQKYTGNSRRHINTLTHTTANDYHMCLCSECKNTCHSPITHIQYTYKYTQWVHKCSVKQLAQSSRWTTAHSVNWIIDFITRDAHTTILKYELIKLNMHNSTCQYVAATYCMHPARRGGLVWKKSICGFTYICV